MIKTLRITSIIVVILAVVAFALPAAFGFRGDKQIEQFLHSAGVIEGFRDAKGEKSADSQREVSPLVKQAEQFALYLNPPPKPTPAPTVPAARNEPRPAGPIVAKFKLIGTSRHILQPELSLALIDEPGKGLYWVRQSSKVGHLTIEQIRDGVVVVRDGQSTFELVAERPEKRSLLKANPSSSKANTLSGGRITGSNPQEVPALAAQAVAGEVQVGVEEKEMTEAELKKAIAELEAKQTEEDVASDVANPGVQGGSTDSDSKAKEIAAARKKSISDVEAMRISTKEARGLGRLGRRLRSVQREPSRVKDNSTGSNANSIEPNGVSHPQADLDESDAGDANILLDGAEPAVDRSGQE